MKKSNPHKLTIEKIENGFLLTWDEQLDDAFIKECKEAIAEDDEEDLEDRSDINYEIADLEAEGWEVFYEVDNFGQVEVLLFRKK